MLGEVVCVRDRLFARQESVDVRVCAWD
jgi:hypothetical protein